MNRMTELGLELIRRTSSDLSTDVEARIRAAHAAEAEGSTARNVLSAILENVELARGTGMPICQDTGLTNFHLHLPRRMDAEPVKADLVDAIRLATAEGLLRPNAVDPVTGRNTGDNIGTNLPYFSVEVHDGPGIVIDLMIKGGGSENVGAQYRLPDAGLKAGRDLACV